MSFIIILIIIIAVVVIKPLHEQYQLKTKGVFTVAKLKLISDGVKGSRSYQFEYKVYSQIYTYSFSGQLPKSAFLDSAIFIKVLPDNPKICRKILEAAVPKCLLKSNILLGDLPKTDICDSTNNK